MSQESILLDVVNQMATYTQPSLAAIYGSIDSNTGELVGSGTFLKLRGLPYLLTAGHIALKSEEYIGLAHSRSDAFAPSYITYPYHIRNDHIDICLVRVEVSTLQNTAIVPLASLKLSHTSADINDDVLFIHGYPGERSKFFKFVDGVASKSLPYGTVTSKSQYDWFDDRVHFALDYTANSLIDEKLSQTALVIPHGLSGSAVWKTNQHNLGSSWNPDAAEIVGVVHHWDQNAQSLVATRIEVVRDFLIQSLRGEFAYYRWLKRGSPSTDDWSDWFAASKEIDDI